MKKFLAVALLGLVASVGSFALHRHAFAEPRQTTDITKTSTAATLAVAAGAVITGPVLDLYTSNECTVFADNSAGGSTRNLVINFLGADQTTIVYQQSIAITTGLRAVAVIAPSVAAAAVPTGFTLLPTKTGRFMSFSLSAAGAAAGSLAWVCR